MVNKQSAFFLVRYIEKTIVDIIRSGFKFDINISNFNKLLNDFIYSCELPLGHQELAIKTITQKYISLLSYLSQYKTLGPRLVKRTAFNTYLDIIDNDIGNFFDLIVKDLEQKYTNNDFTDFHDLVFDISYKNPMMIQLSSIVSKYFFNSHNISIGGQVKFHPPGIHDINSTKWHFDGNPNCMKIIIMLDDAVDGNFRYKNSSNPLRHLAFCPLSCISTVDKGFGSYANSVGPQILNPLVQYLPSLDYEYVTSVPTFKGSCVFFHGASILHKGGLNKLRSRPIFQGMVLVS